MASVELVNLLLEIESSEFGGKDRVVTLNDVHRLLAKGADPSYNGNYAVKLAIVYCSLDIIKILLQDGRVNIDKILVDVDVRLTAVGDVEILKILLEHGADPTVKKNQIHKVAIRDGLCDAKNILMCN